MVTNTICSVIEDISQNEIVLMDVSVGQDQGLPIRTYYHQFRWMQVVPFNYILHVPIEATSLNSFKSNPKTTSQDNQYETTARICSLTHISCAGMLLPIKACPFACQDECKPCVSWCFLKSSSIVSDKYSTPLIISSHLSILLSLTIPRLKI